MMFLGVDITRCQLVGVEHIVYNLMECVSVRKQRITTKSGALGLIQFYTGHLCLSRRVTD